MQHPEHYSASESRRRAVLLARGALAATRGRSTDRVDKALERLAEEAVERESAEAQAKEEARLETVRQRAKTKAQRGR